jgi:signal transduction histidine kinase
MNKRQFLMIQLILLTICAFGLEFLIFQDYMIFFALLNPLILMSVVIFMHPKDVKVVKQAPSNSEELEKLVTYINHDINTPLTKIIGFCESALLVDECTEKTAFTKILASALDLKSINTGYVKLMQFNTTTQITKSPIDLCELLRLVMIEFIGTLDEHQIQYVISIPEKPVFIHANSRLIKEALRTLIENVLTKHVPNSKVMIKLKSHTNHCIVIIDNQGDAADLEIDQIAQSIFTFSNDGIKGSLGKTGVALKLTKAIIENHRGLVDYSSDGPKGLTYQVTLPLHQGI